jgi:hypothetical protein
MLSSNSKSLQSDLTLSQFQPLHLIKKFDFVIIELERLKPLIPEHVNSHGLVLAHYNLRLPPFVTEVSLRSVFNP